MEQPGDTSIFNTSTQKRCWIFPRPEVLTIARTKANESANLSGKVGLHTIQLFCLPHKETLYRFSAKEERDMVRTSLTSLHTEISKLYPYLQAPPPSPPVYNPVFLKVFV